MGIISRIKNKIKYKINSTIKPEIIGYLRWNGKDTKGLRISNLTHVSNKGNVSLSKNVFIGHFNYLDGNQKLTIGKSVQITNYVSILIHSSHDAIRLLDERYLDLINHECIQRGEVSIGNNTYLGAHSIVMPGTVIGKGCIISGFSYVSGNIPNYSIVRGIPGKIIGSTKERDKELLKKFPELSNHYYEKNLEVL